MPLDAQTRVILDALEAAGASALGSGTPEQARTYERETYRPPSADPTTLIPVGSSEDQEIDGPGGPLTVRIFRPAQASPVPTIVYLHGGGFVLGSIDTHDPHCRYLCADVGAVVVSVDYRLAPEHPFPAAYEDGLSAIRWAADHIDELGGDPTRLAIAGDSAGANLAAAVALAAAKDGPRLVAQMLIYPKTDFTDNDSYASRVENANGYFLTADMSDWFQEHYLQAGESRDPRASVVLSTDLDDVAPAVMGVGEYDLLRDEVEAYAKRLAGAGIDVHFHRFDGLIHGFYGMRLMSKACNDAAATLNEDFRRLLSEGAS